MFTIPVAPTSPYQRATRCQRLGYQSSPVASGLGVQDLLESLTRVAYQEELARRERIAADLKRKRLEQEHRQELQRQTLVRHFEEDDFFQIEILKGLSSKKNFKTFQIQYFKKGDELLLVIESKPHHFYKEYRFQSCEVDEQRIDYKIVNDRVMVIQVPKRNRSEVDEERIFNYLQQQQDRLNEARARQLHQEQRLRQQHIRELKEQQLQQRKYLQLKKLAEIEKAERIQREKREREEQLRLQRERQEVLQQFFNSFVTANDVSNKSAEFLNINGEQFVQHPTVEEPESETEEESDFEDSLSTPEASDLSDAEDPEVSDISDLIEQNTIKSVSSLSESENESESESENDNGDSNKRRKLRSPLLEDVEDEEFLRWRNQ